MLLGRLGAGLKRRARFALVANESRAAERQVRQVPVVLHASESRKARGDARAAHGEGVGRFTPPAAKTNATGRREPKGQLQAGAKRCAWVEAPSTAGSTVRRPPAMRAASPAQ